MASNYFTRPKGLHPTPATCFPPRPGPRPAAITIQFSIVPNPMNVNDHVDINVEPRNPNLPVGTPVSMSFSLPGFPNVPSTQQHNYVKTTERFIAIGPAATYDGQINATWSSGVTRTINYLYTQN